MRALSGFLVGVLLVLIASSPVFGGERPILERDLKDDFLVAKWTTS